MSAKRRYHSGPGPGRGRRAGARPRCLLGRSAAAPRAARRPDHRRVRRRRARGRLACGQRGQHAGDVHGGGRLRPEVRTGHEPRPEVADRRVHVVRRRGRRRDPAVRHRGRRLGGLAQACAGGRDPGDPDRPRHRARRHRASTSPASRPTTSRSARASPTGRSPHFPDGGELLRARRPRRRRRRERAQRGLGLRHRLEPSSSRSVRRRRTGRPRRARACSRPCSSPTTTTSSSSSPRTTRWASARSLAVEEAGLVPGVDVKIATIDGTKAALEALADRPAQLRRRVQPAVRRHRPRGREQGARRRVGRVVHHRPERDVRLARGGGRGAARPAVLSRRRAVRPRWHGCGARSRRAPHVVHDPPRRSTAIAAEQREHAMSGSLPIVEMQRHLHLLPGRQGARRRSTSGSSRARSTP